MGLRLRSRIKGRYPSCIQGYGIPQKYFRWNGLRNIYVPESFDYPTVSILAYIDIEAGRIIKAALNDNAVVLSILGDDDWRARLASHDDLRENLEAIGTLFTKSMKNRYVIPNDFYTYLCNVFKRIKGESITWD